MKNATMISIENLEKYSYGNVGAFHVLELLTNHENQDLAGVIWETIVKNNIIGYPIYTLFLISRHSFERLAEICLSVPGDVLIEASRNYQGIYIINNYLDSKPKTINEFKLRMS